MSKTYYDVSIQYEGQSIDFWIQLSSNTDLEQFRKYLRKQIYIEIKKEED